MVDDVLVALEVLCNIDSIAVVFVFDDFWIRGQNSFCLGQKRGSDSRSHKPLQLMGLGGTLPKVKLVFS